MSDTLVKPAPRFWCVRGSFKLGGFVDIGTQCALIERPSGTHLFLDSYPLKGAVRQEIMAVASGDDGNEQSARTGVSTVDEGAADRRGARRCVTGVYRAAQPRDSREVISLARI